MRLVIVMVIATVSAALIAGCAASSEGAVKSTVDRPLIPRPLVERELPALLLTPAQVNSAMGASAMMVLNAPAAISGDDATVTPAECIALDEAADSSVYATSGSWAERDQSLNDGDGFTHYLKQAVVLFPTIDVAQAFLTTSAQRWPACTHFTHAQSGTQWSVGQLSSTSDLLSAVTTELDAGSPGWGCGRALAQRNNIIIDINTCSPDPADSAVRIARQIGDNVAAHW